MANPMDPRYRPQIVGQGMRVTEAQMRGEYPALNMSRGYVFASTSVAASATSAQTYNFPIAGRIHYIGASCVTGGTAGIGNLDAFLLQLQRQSGDFINTSPAPGTTLFGLTDAKWWLPTPLLVFASEAININITNNNASSAITLYLNFQMSEMRN